MVMLDVVLHNLWVMTHIKISDSQTIGSGSGNTGSGITFSGNNHTAAPLNLDQEFLAMTRRNLLRNPIPVLVGMSAIAIAASGSVDFFWIVAWLVLSFSGVLGRVFIIRHVLNSSAYSEQQSLRFIYSLNVLNAVVLCLSLVFFPSMSAIDAVLMTLVMGFLVMGVVITNAGFSKACMPYVSIVLIALAAMWALFPHSEGDGVIKAYVLSAFIVFMNVALLTVCKDIHRLFRNSVDMRQKYTDINFQLSESLDQAHAANMAKTRFLAAASHDLRQPVHTLSLLTAALISKNERGSDSKDSVREIANTMDQALNSLAVQLDSLLDVSKLDAGVITPAIDSTDVASIIYSLKREFSSLAYEKNLSITLSSPASAIAETDATLLERLLRNLIANAIKYTEQGEVVLSVELENDDVVVRIADTGIGIAEDQQALIFEEFYQVDNPHRDRKEGLGLGLSIVTRICSLLEADLSLRSQLDEGSEFTLRLRRGEPSEQSQSANNEDYVFQGLRVLVVDDEASILLATKLYLEALGCEVLTADDGQRALILARENELNLAIVDMRLRNSEHGIDVIKSLQEVHPGLSALLITGDTAPNRLQEASTVNAKLLHKPINSEQLKAAMKQLGDLSSTD